MAKKNPIENLKPFKKGVDPRRNLKGRPPKLPELDKLLAEVLGEDKDGITAAEAMIKAMRRKAMNGDVRAFEVLFNRAFGKVKEVVEHTGKDGEPIKTEQETTWVIALNRKTEEPEKPAKRKYTRRAKVE